MKTVDNKSLEYQDKYVSPVIPEKLLPYSLQLAPLSNKRPSSQKYLPYID